MSRIAGHMRHNVVAYMALFFAMSGGVALATGTIPGPDGEIDGCHAADGQLRVIGAGEECRKSETALSWNQAGPQGVAGPAGPEGRVGPRGPSGGATAIIRITEQVIPAGETRRVRADCEPGERATGGGAALISFGNTELTVIESYASSAGSILVGRDGWVPRSWTAKMRNPASSLRHAIVQAVCVKE